MLERINEDEDNEDKYDDDDEDTEETKNNLRGDEKNPQEKAVNTPAPELELIIRRKEPVVCCGIIRWIQDNVNKDNK